MEEMSNLEAGLADHKVITGVQELVEVVGEAGVLEEHGTSRVGTIETQYTFRRVIPSSLPIVGLQP